MPAPRIVHTLGSLDPATGGPARSLPALCEALIAAGAEIRLVAASSQERDLGRLAPAAQRWAIRLLGIRGSERLLHLRRRLLATRRDRRQGTAR